MQEIETGKLPIWAWSEMEAGARAQAFHLALHPFTFHHIAIMPDNHQGYGMPIGGIAATKGVVIPEAVGVDIGCGMQAIKTSLRSIDTNTLQNIVDEIKSRIPVGFSHHKESYAGNMPTIGYTFDSVVEREYDSACHQIGTLGGGNHFLEIQKGDDGFIWAMVHSGSRNLGKKVADHYIREAVKYTANSDAQVPEKWELAYLSTKDELGMNYIREMQYCLAFAKASRTFMILDILNSIEKFVPNVSVTENHDIHHNYASLAAHYGQTVLVHRKGATSAERNQIGIIPGSQGTASYIVIGRGNAKSFNSSSHGSGRLMGRNEAKKNLNLSEQIAILDSQGILHDMRSTGSLDEAPGAYKNIEDVMKQQMDLVQPIVKLTPLAVIKG